VPAGCEQRIVPCGNILDHGGADSVIDPTTNTWCINWRIYIPEVYIVQWIDANSSCWEVKMTIGECWGVHPKNGGSYGCMGKCGGGCGNINCGAWARDCLRHDICSWFHTSTDGSSDANCGYAYDLAADDYLSNRFCTGSNCNDLSVCK